MASTRVIGLDIGTSAVRAAEVEFGAGGPSGRNAPTLLRYGQLPLPLGAVRDGEVVETLLVSNTLRQLWSHAGFSSKDVVLGVGNQRVIVRNLDLPWMPLAQLKASLPFQVQEMLPVAASEALLDYYPTGEVDAPQGRMVQGLLVAAQRETVSANVVAVEGAGLRPTMVDLNGFALLRALARGEYASRTVAFVDIGARVTNVVVAASGVPLMVRMLPNGGQNVTDAVATALSLAGPEAEAFKRDIGVGFASPPGYEAGAEAIANSARTLAEALRNTFVYFTTNHPGMQIEMVVLTGGGSHMPGFGQYLAGSTRLPIVVGDPVAGLRLAKTVDGTSLATAETAVPVGLAFGVAA